MYFPASAGRRLFAAPLLVLSALLALLALVISPATPAHAYDASTSSCAHVGTTTPNDMNDGTQNNYAATPTHFQYPTYSDGSAKTIRTAVLFVDFNDALGQYAGHTPQQSYNQIYPAADWMWKASYNKTWLGMSMPYNGWLRMPSNSTSYNWERGFTWDTHQIYVKDALTKAGQAQNWVNGINYGGGGVDLTQYDMFYIVPSDNAAAIGHSPTFVQSTDTNKITWVWNAATSAWVTIHWAVTFGQDIWGSWGSKIADHETAHTFGLPDLYSFDTNSVPLHGFMGGWDIMGNIGGPGNQYTGWQSWKLGWTRDSQVDCITTQGTSHTATYLDAVENVSTSYKKIAVVQASSTTAYVVESRKNVTGSADTNLCATGALIYLVDWSVNTGYGPIRVVQNPNVTSIDTNCSSNWNDFYTWQQGKTFTANTAYGVVRITVNTDYTGGDSVDTSLSAT